MRDDLAQDRVELKYLLLPDEVEDFLLDLRPARADLSFRVEHALVTTVYFDRPEGTLARRALSGRGRAVKIRLREYLPPEGGAGSPLVWIEVKEREGVTSWKTRFPLPKELVAPFFRGHVEAVRIPDGPGAGGAEERGVRGVRRIRALARGGPLVAVGATCYRRLAIEGGHPRARLTVDQEVTFHVGALDLYEGRSTLDRAALGPPAVEHAGAVAEIKVRGLLLPDWCDRARRDRRPVEFSKFLTLAALAFSDLEAARVGEFHGD
jgi:hypothetical protein